MPFPKGISLKVNVIVWIFVSASHWKGLDTRSLFSGGGERLKLVMESSTASVPVHRPKLSSATLAFH